jgi:hypothetical protein
VAEEGIVGDSSSMWNGRLGRADQQFTEEKRDETRLKFPMAPTTPRRSDCYREKRYRQAE